MANPTDPSTTPSPAPDVDRLADPAATQKAYQELKAQLAAISDADAHRLNGVNVPVVVQQTLGKHPKIIELREEAKTLPKFDISHFDTLKQKTLGLWGAYFNLRLLIEDSKSFDQISHEAHELRALLMKWAGPLEMWGIFSASAVEALRAGSGLLDTANDAVGLATLYKANWTKVDGKVPVTAAQVERSAVVGQQMAEVLTTRGEPGNLKAAELDVRKAVTLLATSYDQVQRAISYLRWDQDDVSEFAPPLFRQKHGPRRKKGSDSSDTGEPSDGAPV